MDLVHIRITKTTLNKTHQNDHKEVVDNSTENPKLEFQLQNKQYLAL